MSGSTPHYPPYSPTHQSRPPFFNHDTFNNGAQNYQTSSQYPPSPHRPVIGSPLPPPSTAVPQHASGPGPYQPLTSSPPFQSHRPFSSHQNPPTMARPYEDVRTTHAHPTSHQPSVLQSPIRDYAPVTNGMSREQPVPETRPQSQGVSSQNLCLFRK